MIHILDALVAKPERLGEVRDLLLQRYLPAAEERGMRLLSEWVAPSVACGAAAGEWVLLWGVPDVAAWWSMRALAGADPQVPAFWRDADARLERRTRRMLAPRGALPGEAPTRARLGPEAWRGQRATAQVSLRAGAGDEARARFEAAAKALPRCVPGARRAELGRNLPGTVNGGDYTLDLLFDDPLRAARWQRAEWSDPAVRADWDASVGAVDAVAYAPLEGGIDAPRIAAPLKRTLLLRVEPWAPADRVLRFERELAAMPDHIPAIRNWQLARVSGPPGRWTHVWAQEFDALEGLQVDYMVHPYHWAIVDRWFDPESSERVVAPELAHVFCTLPASILAAGS